jgi:tetratricopeptide (TPR) repeat protein
MKAHLRLCIATLALVIAGPALAGPEEDGNAGIEAMKAGNYAKAVQLFTRALGSSQLSPDDKEFAYVQRGTAYFQLGNKVAAKLDLERALKIKPDDNEAREGLARISGKSGGEMRAGGGGGDPRKMAQQGMDALNAGDSARAIALFSQVIASGRLSGDDLELAYASRGQAYLKHRDYRPAAQDLSTALGQKGDDAEAAQALAEAVGHLPPPVGIAPVNEALCLKSFTTNGSVITGKTYTTYVDYVGLDRFDAFAGLYRTIGKYTPSLVPWQIDGADYRAGIVKATISLGDSGRQITQEDHIESTSGGLRITMTDQVPGLVPTIDLKGSMCRTLAMLIR